MEKEEVQAVTWEAPEFRYREKGRDWFLSVIIIIASLIVATTIISHDFLLTTLVTLAGVSLVLMAVKKPSTIPFEVTNIGVRAGDEKYSFRALQAYFINRDEINGTQLLILRKERFAPLLVLPLPEEYVSEVEFLMGNNLPEEELEEPVFMKVLEVLGF